LGDATDEADGVADVVGVGVALVGVTTCAAGRGNSCGDGDTEGCTSSNGGPPETAWNTPQADAPMRTAATTPTVRLDRQDAARGALDCCDRDVSTARPLPPDLQPDERVTAKERPVTPTLCYDAQPRDAFPAPRPASPKPDVCRTPSCPWPGRAPPWPNRWRSRR